MDILIPPKKPSWFRILDLFTIGLGAIASLFSLVYVGINKIQTPHATEGVFLLNTVALAFLGIYVAYLLQRRAWLKEFTWIPEYGLMVHLGGYKGAISADFVVETKLLLDAWERFIPLAKYRFLADVTWVFFEQDLDTKGSSLTGRKVKGFVISGTRLVCVDFDQFEPLSRTAFTHELGHIIYGLSTNKWDEAEHHAFTSERGLP